MKLLEELEELSYRGSVLKMQQDLLEQGWDDVVLRVSKHNPENIELIVKKEGYNNIVLTALKSFTVMWSSRFHTSCSTTTMLNTMKVQLEHMFAQHIANGNKNPPKT